MTNKQQCNPEKFLKQKLDFSESSKERPRNSNARQYWQDKNNEEEKRNLPEKLRFSGSENFFSEKIFKFESSILAQDERWRRA